MSPPRKSGFEPCRECGGRMSVTDPHDDCLWCLSSDQDVEECASCQSMNPKELKEKEAKLFLAKAKKDHRSHRRSSSHASSKKHKKRIVMTPGVVRLGAYQDQDLHLVCALRHGSPLFSPAGQESDVQQAQVHQGDQLYPVFPAPGADPATFLNAMFSMFRAMAPAGAQAGPMGPLAFSLSSPAPYMVVPFMPFYPAKGTGPAPMTSPRGTVDPMTSPSRSRVPISSPRQLAPMVDPRASTFLSCSVSGVEAGVFDVGKFHVDAEV
ncbi:hypothetical protein NDU88_003799 [Pleurodeles waltl]|uniref:Uncharacterized protein n=1 Tax=Pleurodeles waltl TaxID=8319 RepID=A0AAV7VEB2_PLEWA|nr:hypothetical protein NDU88_003799 [Pleurodeles waltl]